MKIDTSVYYVDFTILTMLNEKNKSHLLINTFF
jgi:hypothetical protein